MKQYHTGVDTNTAQSNDRLNENIILFCTAVLNLQKTYPNISIEIICVSVNGTSSTSLLSNSDLTLTGNNNFLQSIQILLKKNLGSTVEFTVLKNSAMYFEEELRRLIAAYAPSVFMKLEFPPVNGMK